MSVYTHTSSLGVSSFFSFCFSVWGPTRRRQLGEADERRDHTERRRVAVRAAEAGSRPEATCLGSVT